MVEFKGGKIISSLFKPFPLLKNQHLQTLWPVFFRKEPEFTTSRERLRTEDKDFIDIDWYELPQHPLILIIHGLASSSNAKYVKGLQVSLADKGFATVAINLRGCSGEPNNKVEGYHAGVSHDLDFVISTLKKRYPHRPMGAIGFSLGGNILLKWLSEKKSDATLFAAMSVSAPLQLDLTTERLQQGFSRIYEQYLLSHMKWQQYQKNVKLREFEHLPEIKEKLNRIAPLWKVNTISDFDELITAPLYGFRNADHYYQSCSSGPMIKHIRVPTLILHSKDDPFMPLEIIPKRNEISNSVMIELTEHGGHVGFVHKNKSNLPSYWVDLRAPQFFNQMLEVEGLRKPNKINEMKSEKRFDMNV